MLHALIAFLTSFPKLQCILKKKKKSNKHITARRFITARRYITARRLIAARNAGHGCAHKLYNSSLTNGLSIKRKFYELPLCKRKSMSNPPPVGRSWWSNLESNFVRPLLQDKADKIFFKILKFAVTVHFIS